MTNRVSFKFLILIVFICGAKSNSDYDYYWRDYNGAIPPDAVTAAYGVYIGQVYRNCTLIPGALYSENQNFVGEFYGKFETKTNIKILCSHGLLKWVMVNLDDVPFEDPDCKLVRGGFEGDTFNWYIGRYFHENMWKVSKVGYQHFKALSLWTNSGSYVHIKKFEVLKVCR
ncbi:uncharacterized protein [Onthophagus taurus]|uniref:uncharacterized protein n=1 Tax=Onthophagus taurus TaxID=166361 RepID=UPI0039BE0ECB